ncbi:MAG: hypothetical protein K0R65_1250 [Crocinitomicaceae bacterium]|jgi:hypothetical protein|nr:hypothetical protein [Crocinitomicaceae bacterium]
MKKLLFLCFCLQVFCLSAQRNFKDSTLSTPWVAIHYGANWAQNDLADRFGYLNHLGFHAGYKTNRNWTWAVDGNFIFGERVKLTNLFDGLRDSYGNLTDVNGDIAIVLTLARGYNVNLAIGKVIPIFGSNQNSGLYIHGGAGYLAHKVRVESRDQVIPQLELDYRKGYDRLTTGLNLHQFIGYAFLANSGVVNFYGGIYAQQGFTKNRRTIFYDMPDTPVPSNTRLDVQVGIRAGWFIPIYKRQPKDFYFN